MLRLFGILEKWFDYFDSNSLRLPLDFDNNLFLSLMVIILQYDHVFAIGQSLNFWYMYFNLFSKDFNSKLLSIILQKFFFKLFLHWNKSIREVFYYFLCYRIVFGFELSQSDDFFHFLLELESFLFEVSRVAFSFSQAQKKWNSMDRIHRMFSGGYSRFIAKLSQEIHQDIRYMQINDATSTKPKTIATMEIGLNGAKPSESTSQAQPMQSSVNSQFNLSRMRKNRDTPDLWIKRSLLEKHSEKFRILKKTKPGVDKQKNFSQDFVELFEVKKITGLSMHGDLVGLNRKMDVGYFPYCEKALKEFNSVFQTFYHNFKIERQDLKVVFVDFAIPFDRGDIDLDLDEDW